MTTASIIRRHARSCAGISPMAKIGVAVVALAASVAFTAAAVVFTSLVFEFPVGVQVHTGEALGPTFTSWSWLIDSFGALLAGAVAIAAVVEAVRLVRTAD